MVTFTEDTGRTKEMNLQLQKKKITPDARGTTCVDAKQYQSRSKLSTLVKVIDGAVWYVAICIKSY